MHPRVMMLFLDGVGIGTRDARENPFFASEYPTLTALCNGEMIHTKDARRSSSSVSLKPINATLGVEGLPQSGTGQTALMTGVNAAKHIGKHFGPYPYSLLHPVIEGKNIFRRLREMGKSVSYANAFPEKYFDFIHARKGRTPAMARSWIASGFRLNDSTALAEGRALSADITNERWNANGFPRVRILTPEEAGKRFVEIGNGVDFVLYEYPATDHAGHSQSMAQAVDVLTLLDRFIAGILASLHHGSTTFIMTSDHGNLENLSTRSHTRNAVPFLAIGRHHAAAANRVEDLTDVSSVIEYLLK